MSNNALRSDANESQRSVAAEIADERWKNPTNDRSEDALNGGSPNAGKIPGSSGRAIGVPSKPEVVSCSEYITKPEALARGGSAVSVFSAIVSFTIRSIAGYC